MATLTTAWQRLAEGTYYNVGGSNVHANTRLYMKYGNRDETNNRDTIYWEIRCAATPENKSWATYGYGYDESYSIYDGGTWRASGTYREGSYPSDIITNTERTIASGNWTQNHNSDGNWSTTLTFNGSVYGTSYTRYIDISLPTIPRASSVACSSPYIGDVATITIDKKSSSFTSTVTYSIGSITGTVATKTSSTVLSFNTNSIKSQIYALIPNARSQSGTIYCTTYSGNTQIGNTQSTTFNLYAKEEDCKPTVNGTVIDTNSNTIALTGDSSIIVKNASKPKVTISATPKYSSSISSYSINLNDGQTSNSREYTFDTINSNTITISATDSRGYSTTSTINLSSRIVNYIKPQYTNVNIERTESTSNTITLNLQGNFYNGNFSETATLRNVRVGDDLSGKTVYFNFPEPGEVPLEITFSPKNIIVASSGNKFVETGSVDTSGENDVHTYKLDLYYENQENTNIYEKVTEVYYDGSEIRSYSALQQVVLPSDFGIVTSIKNGSTMYQYIFIQDESGNNNTLTINCMYKESGTDSWTNGGTITPTISNNTFTVSNLTLGTNFDYEKEWQFKIITTDLLNTIGDGNNDIITVTKGLAVVEIGDELVNINGGFTINDAQLQANASSNISGGIKIRQSGDTLYITNNGSDA